MRERIVVKDDKFAVSVICERIFINFTFDMGSSPNFTFNIMNLSELINFYSRRNHGHDP